MIRQPNGGVGVGTEAAQAFEFLAERTLLGNQARPPTIHVHGPPKRKSSRENASQTGSGTGRVTTVTSAYTHSHSHSQSNSNTMVRSGSRATKSHGHSNSMGTSTSHKSLSTESSQNSRAQSVGKSALRLVKTTASNAAAFCGFGGSPQEGEEEFTSAMEKPDLIEGALRGNGTKVIKLQDQARMDERIRNGEGGESGHVVVITPTLASAALGMVGSGGGNGYGNGNGNGNGNLNVSNNNNYSPSAHATFGAGISGAGGVSPTPSGFSTSVEGIGIAISSPPPSHSDHSYPHTFAHQQQYFPPDTSEPVILPSHPYGQATAFSYNQPAKLVIPPEAHSAEGEIEESPISAAESNTTKRRQPILVHPYAHPGHPYASTIAQTYPHQLSAAPTSDGLQPRIESSIDSDKLYAELTPGHIRKIDPNEIQYSPFSATFPHRREDSSIDAAVASSLAAAAADGSGSGGSGSGSGSGAGPTERHPYGPPVNRFSELGFGDALVRTLRDRGSMDSGLGTDETSAGKSGEGRVGERTGEGEGTTPPHGIHATFELESRKITAQYRHDPNVFPPLQPAHHVLHRREDGEDRDQTRMFVAEPESTSSTSHLGYFDHKSSRMRQASFGTVSQDQILPFDSTPPSYIRRAASTGTGLSVRAGRSSGSSPGMVSHDSSPPVSPRPINLHTSDDLERFRDLFYRPPETRAFTESPRRGLESRQNSGSIMLDVSSHSSRSVSGLTNLARQLSEDLEELRQEEEEARQRENSSLSGVSGGSGGSRMGGRDSPMWGARYGGMRGQRPDEMSLDDPNLVLSSQVSSDAESPPGGAALPLRLPTDGPFVQPVANFPEDIEPEEMESSRASSILDTAQFIEDIHREFIIRVSHCYACS